MEKITSFTIDHIRLIPGVYVSRKDPVGDTVVTTFDIRMTSPNDEPVMNTAEIHAIEHLGATFLRNHPVFGPKIVYFGPMGCRTGFYFLTRSLTDSYSLNLIKDAFKFIADFWGQIPGATMKECGNCADHNLPQAKEEASAFLEIIKDWTKEDLKYPTE